MINKKNQVITKAYFKSNADRKNRIREIILNRGISETNRLKNREKYRKNNTLKTAIRNATKEFVKKNKSLFTACVVCGSKKKIEIHHTKYTMCVDDWMCVCSDCHKDIHYPVRVRK